MQRECSFLEVSVGQQFRDPALPHAIMVKISAGDSKAGCIGQARIRGDKGSPVYTYGPNKQVLVDEPT